MRKRLNILGTLIACLMLAAGIFCLPVSVWADEEDPAVETAVIDPSKTGSITIAPVSAEDQTLVEGMEFALYFLGSQDPAAEELHFITEPAFEGANRDLNNLTEDDVPYLLGYAQANEVEAVTVKADADGIVRFPDLKQGLYIVVPTNTEAGTNGTTPALISVPTKDDKEGWIYDVQTYPKTALLTETSITVRKVWNTGGKSHPDSVTVSLYKGNEKVDTVVLNEKNEWQYAWFGLEESEDWTIKEAAIKGYTQAVSKRDKDNVITVTNTPTLITTGQLKWPIPWLAAGGVVLLGLGVWLFTSKKKNAE